MNSRIERIVLDTNVVVSAFLNPAGAPAQVLTLILAGELTMLSISGSWRVHRGAHAAAFARCDSAVDSSQAEVAGSNPVSRSIPRSDSRQSQNSELTRRYTDLPGAQWLPLKPLAIR